VILKSALTDSQLRTVIEWQLVKGCMEVAATQEERWAELTEIGEGYRAGTPDERLIERVRKDGPIHVAELLKTEGVGERDAGQALGLLKRAGVLLADEQDRITLAEKADLKPIQDFGRLVRRIAEAGRLALGQLSAEDIDRIEQGSRKRAKGKGVFRVGRIRPVRSSSPRSGSRSGPRRAAWAAAATR